MLQFDVSGMRHVRLALIVVNHVRCMRRFSPMTLRANTGGKYSLMVSSVRTFQSFVSDVPGRAWKFVFRATCSEFQVDV